MRILIAVTLAVPLFAQTDWPGFGHDPGGQRYSPLTQVNAKNVTKLKLAWQYGVRTTEPRGVQIVPGSEVTPLVANGLMFFPTTAKTIVALQPETGKEVWKYDLGEAGAPRRGLTFWAGDKQNVARVFVGSSDGKLIALDAMTGKPVPGFGTEGTVNLRLGVADNFPKAGYRVSSPGSIYRDLIITGAQGQEDNPKGPLQDVRAWDVRTGKLVWTFHLNPHPGEPGNETWPKDSWIDAGSPAAWGPMSVDTQKGLVFLPVGQPAPQYYGGGRPGLNLFSSSVVALDAATGKLRWHFQMTHHDVWDLDAAVAPALIDVTSNGKKVPAVVAISKASLMFFLNRADGKSIYPVEERPVPQSDVPGEQTWPTQPFPVKPPPLARLSIGPDDIFRGDAEHAKFCSDLVAKMGGIRNQGAYTPYSEKEYRVIFPGQVGGVNFGGVAVDPKLGYVFVNSIDEAGLGKLVKQKEGDPVAYRRVTPLPGEGTFYSRFWNPATQWPCQNPPWAHLMAVNANTGEIAWKVVLGSSDELEARGIHNTGSVGPGGSMVTAGGVVFIGATIDKRFRGFDSHTGKLLWETMLESGGHSTPMTYLGKNGKQYVAIVSSGLNVFALE